MLRCGLFILVWCFSFSASAANVELTDRQNLDFRTEKEREIVYDKQGGLFSGAVMIPDDEGRKITYFYRDGLKHGVAVSHFEDGKMELETTYRKGKKDGEEILFYENGNPQIKHSYKNNLLHGKEFLFYEDGKPRRQNNYKEGVLDGTVADFNENGQQTLVEHYKNGIKEGIEHIIENNMLKQENNYLNGKMHGITKIYNDKYLVEEIEYKDGVRDGISRSYSENGNTTEIPYVNGKKNGVGFAYYPDKKIANKAIYINDQKNGMSERYFKTGKVQLRENYKNDQLEGITRRYNEDGELLSVSYFVNGTELSSVKIANNIELDDIYRAHRLGQLGKYIAQKNLWYPILWLGINTEDVTILEALKKEMKMYSAEINDTKVYQRESKARYNDYNRQLFLGLTPLGYAVTLSAPVDILQYFAVTLQNIEEASPRGGTPLIEAIRLNNLEMVKFLLLKRADVTKVYSDGNTVLLYAVKEHSQLPIIEELIKAGADVNAKDAQGNTAIMLAIAQNNVELVKFLTEHGADLQGLTPDGKTLLFYAFAENADERILSAMFTSGADVNKQDASGNLLLLKALQNGNLEMFSKLIEAGADVNLSDKSGENAVGYVLYNRVDDTMFQKVFAQKIDIQKVNGLRNKLVWKMLIEQKRLDLLPQILAAMGNITQPDALGEVPLQYMLQQTDNPQLQDIALAQISVQDINDNPQFITQILQNKDFESWQTIIKKEFNANIEVEKGMPLISYLIKNNLPLKYLESLESLPLDVNQVAGDGITPLVMAINQNNLNLAENLVVHGADVNCVRNGENCLVSLRGDQADFTKMLIEGGANLVYTSPTRQTMMMKAVENLNTVLLRHLLEQNADVAARDVDGNSAIMYLPEALQKNNQLSNDDLLVKIDEILALLVQKGADINSQNGNGETTLIRLAKQQHAAYPSLKKLLLSRGLNENLKDQYGKTAADYLAD